MLVRYEPARSLVEQISDELLPSSAEFKRTNWLERLTLKRQWQTVHMAELEMQVEKLVAANVTKDATIEALRDRVRTCALQPACVHICSLVRACLLLATAATGGDGLLVAIGGRSYVFGSLGDGNVVCCWSCMRLLPAHTHAPTCSCFART